MLTAAGVFSQEHCEPPTDGGMGKLGVRRCESKLSPLRCSMEMIHAVLPLVSILLEMRLNEAIVGRGLCALVICSEGGAIFIVLQKYKPCCRIQFG